MATLYKINPHTLELIQVSNITEHFELFGVVSIKPYETIFDTDINLLKYTYQHYDTFYNNGKADSDIHYHDDEELRLILQGKATFYIHHHGFLYIVDCKALELIQLQPNVVHWFTSDDELLVYRFFKDNTSRIAYEPTDTPDYLINIKNYIDTNGRKFEI